MQMEDMYSLPDSLKGGGSAAYDVFIAGHLSHSVDQILHIACIVYVASFDCTSSLWFS